MRTVYRVLAYLIAAEVAVQAAAVALALAGLGRWVQHGGVLDSSAMDGEQTPFPEVVGFIVHGLNGSIVVPALAVLLLVAALFARVPRGVVWAGAVLALVAVQVLLGFSAGDLPVLGALHGINALLLFATAFLTARRARARTRATAEQPAASASAAV